MGKDRKTIFLVDDDITNLTIGNNTLSELYNVFTINSGALLFKMLERHIPDLILLDVEMPEIDGYETIKQLKEKKETSNVPVIFLTAKSETESQLEGLSLGAVDYVIKPFSPPLLLKRIEVNLLVESQKTQLVNLNNNLQKMVEKKTETIVELQNAILKTMAELVECRDDITGGHIERTERYLRILLNAVVERDLYHEESSTWKLDLVTQSAQLHDVGKIAIKDNILKKPGKLTAEEFEKIKEHTLFGEEVINGIMKNTKQQAFLNYAKVFAGSHHENWDGTGYPRGLKETEIPLLGRLMAIVDVYDALVSVRPYKGAFSHEEAVKIISDEKGTRFDPSLIELFVDVSVEFNQISSQNRENQQPRPEG